MTVTTKFAELRSLTPARLLLSLGMLVACIHGVRADELPAFPAVTFAKTPAGVPFAYLGEKPSAPAPTLFVFGADMRNSLISEDVNRLGRILIPHGYFCVSVDIPGHGTDVRPGEKSGDLAVWKDRVVKGENIVTPFTRNVTAVLDYLVAEKWTDPAQVVVSGTSRGGFAAFHAAAADERFKHVIAFAPVTHLGALAEFKGAETNELTLALHPVNVADKLVGRQLWIVIGNQDLRVSTQDSLKLAQEVIQKSQGKLNPIPVELRLVGTIGHRLHSVPTPEYSQFCAPHEEAANWLLVQRVKTDSAKK